MLQFCQNVLAQTKKCVHTEDNPLPPTTPFFFVGLLHLHFVQGTSTQHLYSRKFMTLRQSPPVFTRELLSHVLSNGGHFLIWWDFT